jgi:hypothetical protein
MKELILYVRQNNYVEYVRETEIAMWEIDEIRDKMGPS